MKNRKFDAVQMMRETRDEFIVRLGVKIKVTIHAMRGIGLMKQWKWLDG